MLNRIGNELNSGNFIEIKFFVFSVEAFQFSKFHENEAKHDKPRRGLSVAFEVKNAKNYSKNRFKTLQAYLFVGQ